MERKIRKASQEMTGDRVPPEYGAIHNGSDHYTAPAEGVIKVGVETTIRVLKSMPEVELHEGEAALVDTQLAFDVDPMDIPMGEAVPQIPPDNYLKP